MRPAPAFAQAQSVTLTITHAGSSGGTVGVVPSGRLCSGSAGATCAVTLTSGDAITLSANGLTGGGVPGVFSAGTGSATSCATSTCIFTITADSAVTVTFDPSNGPIVVVTPSLAGDGQGEVGLNNSRYQNFDPAQFTASGTTYVAGSVVSLRATAAADARFSGYSAGTNGAAACGTASTCSFTANANTTVTATFHALTALSVTPATASISVTRDQTFTAQGTYSNGVTETIAPGLMGTWRTRAVMPTGRFSLAAVGAAGSLYAIGGMAGLSPGEPSALVERYDPVTNTWSTGQSMSTPREGLAAAEAGGFIYAIGGNTTGSSAVGTVERFDPSADVWIARASLAAPRRFLAAATLNGIVYAIGGETADGTVGTVEAYDPSTDSWTPRASLTTARKLHAAAAGNGLLYVMGGLDAGGAPISSLEVYDPVANTWTTKASMPGARSGLAAAFVDGIVYAAGGKSGSVSSTLTGYDISRNQWFFKSGMPTSRSDIAAAVLDGVFYAVGGHQNSTFPTLQKNEAFTDSYRWRSSNTAVATIDQQGRAIGAGAGQADMIASIGGLSCSVPSTCGRLTVTLSTMALDRTSLAFGATSTGSGLSSVTPPQQVRMTLSGGGTVTWTATSNQPWLVVSPTSGSGSAILNVSIASNASGAVGNFTAAISIVLTGAANTVGPINATLAVQSTGTAPFGSMDTPLEGATNVVGSIPVTGWALDDIAVTRVRLVRLAVTGEPPGSEIFIGDANVVEGARPDVAGQFPNAPKGTAAGWGYLLLTNFLPNQGNGTFTLRAYADDADGRSTLLGSRTITCTNSAATTPFGAIDTPGQGETVSGLVNNFGWVLSPGSRRADPPNGGVVTVFVDGVPAGVPSGWVGRSDLAALFPAAQYSGVGNALGVYGLDTTLLANGVHTIAWGVTDNNGGGAGVGSRYFTVSNGSSVVSPPLDAGSLPLSASRSFFATQRTERVTSVTGRRGFELDTLYEVYEAGRDGVIAIESEELDRIELQFEGATTGYQKTSGQLRPLPIGAHVDQATGVFTWQPGVGFVGAYDFVFVNGAKRIDVRIVLNPKGQGRI